MTKSASDRAAKFAAKNDPTVIGQRFTAVKESSDAKQAVAQGIAADTAASVAVILNACGVAPMNRMPYQAFANKLIGITNKYSGLTATNEATKHAKAWVSDGYDYNILYQIWGIFNAQLGTAPSPLV